jgi:cytochrome c-type biogenesis protein CcmH
VRRALQAICLAAALAATFGAAPAWAVRPDEMLSDPALEARARALSKELRCLVCQNESIDDSNADLAHDLRVLVRDRIKKGDTDQEALDYLVARYGEFVLLKPRFDLRNAALWGTPVVLLLAGGLFMVAGARRRRRLQVQPLSSDERMELDAILSEGKQPRDDTDHPAAAS